MTYRPSRRLAIRAASRASPVGETTEMRRLAERGVSFVQLYINGQIWDNLPRLPRG
jgi:hypothetical protein